MTLANALLVGQVAFSFVLLVTAALFLRSIQRAYADRPGLPDRAPCGLHDQSGTGRVRKAADQAFYKDVRERVARIPGVESVSWASNLPLWARAVNGLQVEGRQQRSQADQSHNDRQHRGPRLFRRQPAWPSIAGASSRTWTRRPRLPVAIVNEKMAHDYWPGGERWESAFSCPARNRCGRSSGLPEPPIIPRGASRRNRASMCRWNRTIPTRMTLYVRSKGDPRQILIPVQREITRRRAADSG